jgi:amidohydrolase
MKHKLNSILLNKIEAIYPRIVSYREYLHQHPELSFQEFNTMEFVADKLAQLKIPFQKEVAGTGIVGLIKASHHNENQNCIGLRADLDALPIQEENDVHYKSVNDGIMHACGHDVHTAVLLGAAEILNEIKEELPLSIKLIFQPGEETNPGGASLMIEAGVLENPKVERMYGLHVFPEFEAGHLGLRSGLYMASSDEIHVSIQGIGGHGALPEKCVNPLMIGASFVIQAKELLESICPKEIPHVLTFGRFEALGSTNVVPSTCEIKGTFRTMNEEWRALAHHELNEISKKISSDYNGNIKLTISKGYPFLKNDEDLTATLQKHFEDNFGNDFVHALPIRMTAEDFAFYSQKIPVVFFRLGVANNKKGINYGVHHPKFDIDQNAIKTGIQAMVLAAFK